MRTAALPGGIFAPMGEKESKGAGSMSDEKKKVKDLAVDLGLSPKDVLAAAKDLGITAAKVAASSLSDAEISRLRGHFSPASGADKQEVIVRRRRNPTRAPAPPNR